MRRRPALVLVLSTVLGLTTIVRTQDLWYKVYEDAERAFQKGDYAQAEQLFLKSMRQPLSPTERGVSVRRYSQVLGVIPEYYLAMICSNAGRLDEAYLYAQTTVATKDYFSRGDPRLKTMEDIVSAWTAAHPEGADRGVRMTPLPPITPAVTGAYFALLIGIDDYTYQPKLTTAVADATAVADLLQKDFGFETRILLNATRSEVLHAFNDYRKRLTEKDNLLIYYAGHGYMDLKADRVYWLPVDAEKDDTTNWIIADEITSSIQMTAARHVLLVSDSCYAGGLTRAAELDEATRDRGNYLRKMIQSPSRSLMSSGGLEPVSDGGGDGHSVFARALLFQLSKPRDDAAFTAGTLFQDVKQAVAGRSGQVPDYSPIKKASLEVGDKGDFVFVRQAAVGKAPRH